MTQTLKRLFQVLTFDSPPQEVTWEKSKKGNTYYLLDSVGRVEARILDRQDTGFCSVRFTAGEWVEIYGLARAVKYVESKTRWFKILNDFPGDLS